MQILTKIFIFPILIFSIFLVAKTVKADDNFLLGYGVNTSCSVSGVIATDGIGGGWGPYIFDSPATTTNISKIDLYLRGNETKAITIRFCSGPYDATQTMTINEQCNGNAQQKYHEQTINITTNDAVNYKWYSFDLTDFALEDRANNFFTLSGPAGTSINITRCINSSNPYPGGAFSYSSIVLYDARFKLNYNPDFVVPGTPNTDVTPNLDFALLDWRSDINTVRYMMCFLGDTDCKLYFSFNDKAVGKKVYITPDVAGLQNPQSSYFYTTIYYRPEWQNEIDIPTYTVPDKRDYCLYLRDDDYGDLLNCGITIEWMSTSTFMQKFEGRFPENQICESVATSTGSLLDDIRYALECGGRRFMWWAFKADERSLKDFTNSREQLKQAFPFNTYFELNTAISNAVSTTTNDNGAFKMPMIDKSGQFYMMPVLASSSISNTIGVDNNNIFRTTLGWFAWLVVAGLIYATVKQ